MDPCIEEHFKDLLEQWRKDENNIKDQLLEIKREVRNFSKILDDLRETVSSKGEDNDQWKRPMNLSHFPGYNIFLQYLSVMWCTKQEREILTDV